MTADEIKKLSSPERIAGYVLIYAKVAVIGARLRTKYPDDDFYDHTGDSNWSEEESKEWDAVLEEHELWLHSLTPTERRLLDPLEFFLNALACAEVPEKMGDYVDMANKLYKTTEGLDQEELGPEDGYFTIEHFLPEDEQEDWKQRLKDLGEKE